MAFPYLKGEIEKDTFPEGKNHLRQKRELVWPDKFYHQHTGLSLVTVSPVFLPSCPRHTGGGARTGQDQL